MRETTHPQGIKEVEAVKITQEIKDFVTALAKDIETEKGNRKDWETKIDALHDLRYGYRQPRITPWRGAANYSLPLIDAHITRVKPSYVNLTQGIKPICVFKPFSAEYIPAAKKKEILFDWRMQTKVKFFEPYCIGVDKALEQGLVVFKVDWNYSTNEYIEELDLEDLSEEALAAIFDPRVNNQILMQILIEELSIDKDFQENIDEIAKAIVKFRKGETKFSMSLIEVENNQPEITVCDVRHDLVVPLDTTDLQYARFIDQPFYRTTTQIKRAMKDEKYAKYEDTNINSWAKSKAGRQSTLTPKQDDTILFHETCCWYDTDGSGIKRRCIVTFPDACPSDVLRFIEIPYDHGLFPYEDVRRELTDKAFYSSRGIAALDEDYQKGISESVNQSENANTVSMPTVVMRRNTVTNLKNRRYIPMETVETTGDPNDYQIRQNANISQPVMLQLAQYLKSWADQRLGNATSGVTDPTNLPGAGTFGNKTKAEIDLISGLSGEVQSLDLQIWQSQMAKVYFQIDSLYNQLGDEEEEVIITGQPPTKITRRETQGKWHIVPNGRLDNTNPLMRAQKAANLMRMFAGDPDINQYELKKLFITDYDFNISQAILYTPEQRKQQLDMQNSMMEQMKAKALKEGIDLKTIEVLMEVWKEGLLVPITGAPHKSGDE